MVNLGADRVWPSLFAPSNDQLKAETPSSRTKLLCQARLTRQSRKAEHAPFFLKTINEDQGSVKHIFKNSAAFEHVLILNIR